MTTTTKSWMRLLSDAAHSACLLCAQSPAALQPQNEFQGQPGKQLA